MNPYSSDMVRTCPACGASLPDELRDSFCPVCTLHGALQANDGGAATDADWIRRIKDYELIAEIARGGVGVVYRARQFGLNREVAIKLLIAGHFADSNAHQRFRMEASAAARLRHPHIVEIYEVGEHDGQPFLAMEFIDGSTLGECVRESPLPGREAASVMLKIAGAIQFAHGHGILHRDLKPSNILIDQFGEPRVTDFGLAKQLGSNLDLTLTGQVLGSPSFMAPEQAGARHAAISATTDVYSLGAILYHLLTGRPPFQGDSAAAILHQVERSEPIPPRRLNPGVLQDLETIALKCLEKTPARRYPTAQALADDLQRFLSGHPVSARPLGWPGRAWRWSHRNPGGATAIVLLLLLAAASSMAALWISRAERKAQSHLQAAEAMAYVRDLALADRAIEDGELALTRNLLRRHIPREGEPDRRTFEWRLLWRLSEDQSQLVLRGHSHVVSSLALFPDTNRVASASWDGTVRIWDLSHPNAAPLAVLTNDCGRLWSVDVSRNGNLLLAAGESGATLWETDSWRPRQRIGGFFGYGCARLFPDGDKALLATRETNLIWNFSNNQTLPGLQNAHSPIAFSRAGDLLATRSGNSVRVWNARTLALQKELVLENFPSFGLRDLAFSPDQRWLAIGSSAGRVALLDWQAPGPANLVELTLGGPRWPHLGWVGEINFSPSGLSFITAGADHQALTWSVRRRVPILQFRGHEHEVWAATFSLDGQKLITAGKDETVRVWSPRSDEGRRRFAGIAEPIGAWGNEELLHVLTSTNEPRRRLAAFNWNISRSSREFDVPNFHLATSYFFQPRTGHFIFRTAQGKVELWNLRVEPPRLNCALQLGAETAQKLCISDDSDGFATYSQRGHSAQLWNLPDATPRFTLENAGGVVVMNRNYLISQPTWETPRVFNARSGQKLADLVGHKEQVSEALLLPDGHTVVTASWDGTVRFWELPSGRLLNSSRSQRQGLYSLALSPDGQTLATGGQDGVTRFWNIGARQETTRIMERETISRLWFTPDGTTLVERTEKGIRLVRAPFPNDPSTSGPNPFPPPPQNTN